jgi:transposase
MARRPRGGKLLEMAQGLLAKASGADEVRTLQAVVFPLAFGMSIGETARAVGRSVRWTTGARNKFIRAKGMPEKARPKMRCRAHMAEAEEAAFLAPFMETARRGGMLVVGAVHAALEARPGRRVARATACSILHRHGWRKLAPDRRHVSADPKAQDDWGKNSGAGSGGSKGHGKGRAK